MSYMHIESLYRNPDIFLVGDCFCLEKIHGTSAHITWKKGELKFFAGGTSHENFVKLFDVQGLTEKFKLLGHDSIVVFGEAYGGKLMGMRDTYGPNLKFAAFDVKLGDRWYSVPGAHDIANKLGLEFVHYNLCTTDIASLDRERDAPSEQAKRNGIVEPKIREGIVIRPIIEASKNGVRIIAKHKRPEFMETKTPREVDPAKLKVLTDAREVSDEWVTRQRLLHVLDKNPATSMKDTPNIIRAMIEDVKREGAGEIEWSKDVETAIGRATAALLKAHFKSREIEPFTR